MPCGSDACSDPEPSWIIECGISISSTASTATSVRPRVPTASSLHALFLHCTIEIRPSYTRWYIRLQSHRHAKIVRCFASINFALPPSSFGFPRASRNQGLQPPECRSQPSLPSCRRTPATRCAVNTLFNGSSTFDSGRDISTSCVPTLRHQSTIHPLGDPSSHRFGSRSSAPSSHPAQ